MDIGRRDKSEFSFLVLIILAAETPRGSHLSVFHPFSGIKFFLLGKGFLHSRQVLEGPALRPQLTP